jgi:hypothetical protein
VMDGLLRVALRMMSAERQWSDTDRGKHKYWEENMVMFAETQNSSTLLTFRKLFSCCNIAK